MASPECPPNGSSSAHNSLAQASCERGCMATVVKSRGEGNAYLTDIRIGDKKLFFLIECGPRVELRFKMGVR